MHEAEKRKAGHDHFRPYPVQREFQAEDFAPRE